MTILAIGATGFLGPHLVHRRMDDDRPAILMDEGQAAWRWTHGYVENVAAAIATAATNERAADRIYNVGGAETPTTAARERGRVGGRPPALGKEEIPQVQAMMRDEEVSTSDICERFGISRATLYRYVGPDGERRR